MPGPAWRRRCPVWMQPPPRAAPPVIGVPLKGSSALEGVDALYSIVQMPPGVPVATVAIDGAKNAAYLAVSILGVKHPTYREKMIAHKEQMARKAREAYKRSLGQA